MSDAIWWMFRKWEFEEDATSGIIEEVMIEWDIVEWCDLNVGCGRWKVNNSISLFGASWELYKDIKINI